MGKIDHIENADAHTLERFDAVIDVRTPAEFAEDHIPGALNLPVLSNAERAEVGTLYKQVSKFDARRIGAAYVARNVAGHLTQYFTDKPGAFRPLLYCWRGGMRSGAMATIISQVGWRTGILKGGYKTWRRAVVANLRCEAAPLPIVLLDGQTGTAKSALIERLAALGAQTLDLERLADHRGSVFGALPGANQPSQKMFESLLWCDLSRLDAARPILVEAESSRIGRLQIPKRLWRAMQAAPRIVLSAGAELRADYILEAYADFTGDQAAIYAAVEKLKGFHSKEKIEAWRDMAEYGDYRALVADLMRAHYDPLYDRARKRRSDRPLAAVTLKTLDATGLDRTAKDICKLIERLRPHCAPGDDRLASAP